MAPFSFDLTEYLVLFALIYESALDRFLSREEINTGVKLDSVTRIWIMYNDMKRSRLTEVTISEYLNLRIFQALLRDMNVFSN